MKVIPRKTHWCHVCDARFVITASIKRTARGLRVRKTPARCPECGAPRRFATGQLSDGRAQSMVLACVDARARRNYGSVERFLRGAARTPEQVHEILDFAASLDFDGYVRRYEGVRRTPVIRSEIAALETIHAELEAGTLRARLEQEAAAYLDELRQERARYRK
ncbi:MAG: hypothetical protein H6713_34525 [Myxococcales bacterium]|nr:hypothetical protein [Myxococcales bacterium]